MPSLASYQAFWASRSMTFQPQPEMVFGARAAGGAAAAVPAMSAAARPSAANFMVPSPLVLVSDRRVAGDGGAVHHPAMAVVAAEGVVRRAAVVPDHQHVRPPAVTVDELVLVHVLVETAQELEALGLAHALDGLHVDRRDEQRL